MLHNSILQKVWKLVFIWAVISFIILSIAKVWDVVIYGITYCFIFGGLLYKFRNKIGRALEKLHFKNFIGFALLVTFLTVIEELYVLKLSGPEALAHPTLWVNLVLVSSFWLVWLSTWYFYLSKKYVFTKEQAILTAGFSGIMYELVGTLKIFDINAVLFITPISILVYATVAIIPMQLIDFTGQKDSKAKYLISVVLPFLITIPVALILYFIFIAIGVPI